MKSETKKALFFLFLAITYSLQAIVSVYQFSYVYFFGFMVAVALLYVIKNKYIGAFAGILILMAAEFYDTNYKYLTVIAFLLICAHKNLKFDLSDETKKKKDSSGFSFILVQLTVFATIALFVYDFILIAKTEVNIVVEIFSRAAMIFLWLIVILVYSLLNNHSMKKSSVKINKQLSGSLRFMYLVSIFAFSATVLFSYAEVGSIHISYNAVFFPWFLYICSMVYNGDPYVKSLAESIGNLLKKISYKDKVSK